jgi:hypothetical protein
MCSSTSFYDYSSDNPEEEKKNEEEEERLLVGNTNCHVLLRRHLLF